MDNEKKTNTEVKSKDKISYEGKVKISLMKGNKIINTKTYHNEGTDNLFYGLVFSLMGDYASASAYRPTYLDLYTLGTKGTPVTNIIAKPRESNLLISNNKTSLSTIIFNSTPIIDKNKVSESSDKTIADYATITYKFLIPYTQIDTAKDTNCIALYGRDDGESAYLLAYIVVIQYKADGTPIVDEDGNNKLDNLIPSVDKANDYNLFVQ